MLSSLSLSLSLSLALNVKHASPASVRVFLFPPNGSIARSGTRATSALSGRPRAQLLGERRQACLLGYGWPLAAVTRSLKRRGPQVCSGSFRLRTPRVVRGLLLISIDRSVPYLVGRLYAISTLGGSENSSNGRRPETSTFVTCRDDSSNLVLLGFFHAQRISCAGAREEKSKANSASLVRGNFQPGKSRSPWN